LLSVVYASAGRYAEAADALLAMRGSNLVRRQTVEDAARLLRTAPAKVSAPETLPALGGLSFVYAHIGMPERSLELPERLLALGNLTTAMPWFPEMTPVRKSERFKTLMRNAGLVDYWRARGWPDLCRPLGAEDFECD
jgi:hypothetical protein